MPLILTRGAYLAGVENQSALREDLEKLSGLGDQLWRDVYRRWFDAHPEVRELFEVHSYATKREMLDATLVAVYDLVEESPWSTQNLVAYGARHETSYEVLERMYPGWTDAVIEAIRAALGSSFDAAHEMAWREALERVEDLMKRWRGHARPSAVEAG